MKLTVLLFLLPLILLLALVSTSGVNHVAALHPCASPVVFGDVNDNDQIDEGDAAATKAAVQGKVLLDLACGVYDVDCDGDVDLSDASKIRRASRSLPYKQNEPCPDIGSILFS